MRTLTTFVLRHKLLVTLGWLLVLGCGVATVGTASQRLDASFTLPSAPGYEANVAIAERFGNGGAAAPIVVVVTLPPAVVAGSPDAAAAFETANKNLAAQGLRGVAYQRTADDRTAFALVFKPEIPLSAENAGARQAEVADRVAAVFRAAMPEGSTVRLTGTDAVGQADDDAGSDIALTETVAGAVGAFVVLAVVFGSLLAFLPLLVAAVSILSGFLVVLGLTYVVDVADLVQYMLAFIGLGVAIDYALLFVTRWREERLRGHSNEEAIHRTMATAGKAVLVSGATVAAGMVVLVVLPSPALRSLALGVILVPAFSVLVTMTLLPALLAVAGPRLDWPAWRTTRSTRSAGRLWQRWATAVVRHRWLALAAALAVMVPLALTSFTLRLGEPAASVHATGESAEALAELASGGVPSGVLTPVEVLVPAGEDPQELATHVADLPGVYATAAPEAAEWHVDGYTLVNVLPEAETSTEPGRQTVSAVREALSTTFPGARVGGGGALLIDEIDAEYGDFPFLLALICLVCFVVLARSFRSLLLPLKAVLLNLLSVGAAYGVLVLVWQEGLGSQPIWGIAALGSVNTLVPLLTFAFLFGLSMDYEVFLLARMREEYDATHSTETAIVTGLGRVGRLVTAAALILFLAFASLAGLPEVHAKVMATGLGAGILLDATILRMVLLPALMAVAGRWNWWLPRWAARIFSASPLIRIVRMKLAPTPPMGWNSWDCFGPSVTEAEVRANAEFMAKHLAAFGWEYIVVDIQWYEPAARGGGYNEHAQLVLDDHGLPQPALNRFPSAAGGAGFKPLADYVHSLGLKLGVHIMRGIPRQAVDAKLPILGTSWTADQVADQSNNCTWCTDNYGLDHSHPGAQAYYDSLLAQFARWELDFVKADDMIGPFHTAEVEAFSRAVGSCGRPMVLSLSPGVDVTTKLAGPLAEAAQMWRISNDLWDDWKQLRAQFDRLAAWAPYARAGAWPDADMLPIGHVGIRAEVGTDRTSNLSLDEQRTMLTLWCIARSPLMMGGDLPTTDPETIALLTNPEVLAVLNNSSGARQVLDEDGATRAWTAEGESGQTYVAVFNLSNSARTIRLPWQRLGLEQPKQVRDLWARASQPAAPDLNVDLPAHGSALLAAG